MKLVNISNKNNTINLFIRDDNGNLQIQPYNDYYPYFYEPSESGTFKSFTGIKLEKIICKKPGELNRRRTNNSWESDVLQTKRFLIEKVPDITKTNIKYFFVDIEVLTTKGLPNYKLANNTITCISLYNSFTQNIHTWFINDYNLDSIDKQEIALLNDFIAYLKLEQPDILIGWNFTQFDYSYLFNRIKKLYNKNFAELISPIGQSRPGGKREDEIWYPSGISIIDFLSWYKKFTLNRKKSYALEDVAQDELKKLPRLKVDFSILNSDVQEKNYEDVLYLVELEDKIKLIPYYNEIRRMSKCLFEDLNLNSKVVDQLALQEAKNQNVILPRKKYKEDYNDEDDEKKFEGAYRRCEAGLFKNLYEVDISSAYPAAIIEFCLDIANIRETSNNNTLLVPITDRKTCEIKETVNFEQNQGAILPTITKKILVLKDKLKKELKLLNPESQEYRDLEIKYNSVKGLVNSIFGINALKSFRLFDIRVASAIPSLIRDLLHYVELKAKELGIETVYIDTDCLMYKASKDCTDILNNLIQQWAKEKYNKDSIGIVFDNKGIINKIFILSMCHYKAIKGKEEVVRGVESKKKDSSDYIKYFQPKLIDKVMNEEPKEKIIEWIKLEIEKFNNLLPLEIAFPAKLAHEIEDYKTTSVRKSKDSEGKIIKKTFKKEVPIHVRAYRNAKELGLIKEVADNFLWTYVISKDPLKNVMAFDIDALHLVKKEDIDYPKMLERNILNKVENIFIALKWENPFIVKKNKTKKTIAEMVESAEGTEFGSNLRQKQPKQGIKTEISDNDILNNLFKGGLLK